MTRPGMKWHQDPDNGFTAIAIVFMSGVVGLILEITYLIIFHSPGYQ